jgi:predicted DNA-binding WGR domain protein
MSGVTLTRTDPGQNMRRFYRLDVQPDLFGGWSLWREWGRLGAGGQVRHDPYPSAQAAECALNAFQRAKERRGYQQAA